MARKNDPSAKTRKIRAAHGNDCAKCPICCRPAYSPYRRLDTQGKIIEGCVDASHTGKHVPISESERWHWRPEAIEIRRAELAAISR